MFKAARKWTLGEGLPGLMHHVNYNIVKYEYALSLIDLMIILSFAFL